MRLRTMLREHFRPDGKPKQAYRDRKAAELEADKRRKHAYQCGICGRWHIGGIRRG